MARNLFIISNGDYNIKGIEDKDPAMQTVFIIEADGPDTPEMLEAIARFARIKRIPTDQVVVNLLAGT